jgi:uncharacterized protein (TIGR02285 family)
VRRNITVLFAGLAILLTGPLAAAQTITWLTTDLPPQFIYSGEMAGQGVGDLQTIFLTRHLPQFQHQVDSASFPRIWHDMAHKDATCTVGALRDPEREMVAVFSRRPILIPSYRLIVNQRKLDSFRPFMTEKGEIDLDMLAEEPNLRGGYVTARLHSPQIDAFITRPDLKAPVENMVSTLQIFHLMHMGRLDFIFALPFEISYYTQISHYTEEIAVLPIKGSARSIKAYIACSRQSEGSAAIRSIDTLLSSDRDWAQFIKPLKRWLAPADFAAALAAIPED